jgi:hypothetical protein
MSESQSCLIALIVSATAGANNSAKDCIGLLTKVNSSFVVFFSMCCHQTLFTPAILNSWQTANGRVSWRYAGPCWTPRKWLRGSSWQPRVNHRGRVVPRMPGLQDRPVAPHPSSHCRGLCVLAGADDRRQVHDRHEHTVHQVMAPLVNPVRATEDVCLNRAFGRSRNVGSGCQPRHRHPPKREGDHFRYQLSRRHALFPAPVNGTAIQSPCSRSGSGQRIVFEVLRPSWFVMSPAFCAEALQIQCSSSSTARRGEFSEVQRIEVL